MDATGEDMMRDAKEQQYSNMEERCQELIVVARQWEEQMSDLRSFSQIEKEALEGEISSLQEEDARKEQEKQSLEKSLMLLEEERARTCAINELSVQARIETEVKLQLMESALEAVSLQVKVSRPDPVPTPETADSSTSTDDLPLEKDVHASIPVKSQTNYTQTGTETQILPVLDNAGTNNTLDSANQSLQHEVRKLRHQLIISQITAKQFRSECLLYKAKATGSTTLVNKKRKEFCLSPNSKGPPPKQKLASTPAMMPYCSTSRALQCIENRQHCHQPTLSVEKGGDKKLNAKERGRRRVVHSVNMIDESDMFSNICLRM